MLGDFGVPDQHSSVRIGAEACVAGIACGKLGPSISLQDRSDLRVVLPLEGRHRLHDAFRARLKRGCVALWHAPAVHGRGMLHLAPMTALVRCVREIDGMAEGQLRAESTDLRP
jgi:hypothetical protein